MPQRPNLTLPQHSHQRSALKGHRAKARPVEEGIEGFLPALPAGRATAASAAGPGPGGESSPGLKVHLRRRGAWDRPQTVPEGEDGKGYKLGGDINLEEETEK